MEQAGYDSFLFFGLTMSGNKSRDLSGKLRRVGRLPLPIPDTGNIGWVKVQKTCQVGNVYRYNRQQCMKNFFWKWATSTLFLIYGENESETDCSEISGIPLLSAIETIPFISLAKFFGSIFWGTVTGSVTADGSGRKTGFFR